ncbi:MAG: hypothetical protein IKO64_03490 [Kiritimatiellae bacterium]|nr:hypothetical protein [Kiritimatiellia bacterium]
MKRGFTLMEVNLAILIMAGGILAMVSLYSLGYRENRQSREDVLSAALADRVLSPLVMAASSTNVAWSTFRQLKNYPGDQGWAEYFNNNTGIVTQDPHGKAQGAYSSFLGAVNAQDTPNATFPNKDALSCALVIMHEQDSPVVRFGFRATSKPGQLLSMPIFYTEAHFQGDPAK